jgi:VanZ family protein
VIDDLLMESFLKASLPSWLSGLFILLVVPFFFVGGPDGLSPTLIKNAWNFGHIIFFTVFMLLVQSLRPLGHWHSWLCVTLLAIGIGIAIEFVQRFVGRDSSWDDVLHNLFGVWLGLFWGQKPTRPVWFLRCISLVLVAPAFWLVIYSAMADIVMREQFPLINSFESRFELAQVQAHPSLAKTQQVSSLHTHGSYGLQVELGTSKYAGLSLIGPYGDWSGYQFLQMDFYNPEHEPLELVLKISDTSHDQGTNSVNDRFNRKLVLTHGWSQITVDLKDVREAPRNRVMQMDEISGMAVFVMKLSRSRVFYWDNIRLQ